VIRGDGQIARAFEDYRSSSLKEAKKLWVSVPLWFLETLKLRNHRDAEAQRTKKETGIGLPEKKVKKLCVSVPLWFLEILKLRNHRDAEAQRTKKETGIGLPEKGKKTMGL
jgi:transcriptional regulator of met regulon